MPESVDGGVMSGVGVSPTTVPGVGVAAWVQGATVISPDFSTSPTAFRMAKA